MLEKGDSLATSGDIDKIFQLSLDLICIAGADGYFKKINPAFTNVLGYSEKELLETPFIEFIHPDDRERTLQEVETQLKGSPTIYFENRYLHKDGSVRWLAWNAHAADGGLLYAIARDVTGQKQTEAALRESEGRFRTLVETADDAILLMDMDFNRIYENESAWTTLGYTKEEWEKLGPFWERIHPDDIALIKEGSAELFSTGAVSSKYRIRHKDGHYITRQGKSKVVYTGGKPTTVVSILRDITDMERATELLRQNEILMNTAQKMAHIGGWEYDVENHSMVWTDEVYRIHDISREDIPRGSAEHIGRSVKCYDPKDQPVILAAFRKCVENGVPYDLEFPFTSAKGHRMWIRTAGYPVYGKGKDAGIIKVVGHIMDITQRKESDNVFKAIVEGTSSVIGEQFFRSLAQHLAQAMNMRYAFIAEMDDLFTARVISIWADGKIGDNFSYDIRHTPCENVVGKELCVYPENVADLFPKDGWLKDNGIKSYMAIPLANSAGKFFGHMGIMDTKPIFDVDRHIAVLKIFAVRAANELERKAAEEQLKAAKEEAEAATVLKDKFVTLVAHDLRSPLATVSMMLNAALTNLKAARYGQSVDMIERVNHMCETMMEMTVNLLEAAKLQSGDIILNKKMCNIKNICDAVIGDLSYLAGKKGIVLKNEVPDDARLYVDKILFQRVIYNLVTNALKFSNENDTVTTFMPGGQRAVLAVKDTGTGIHESLLPDLFKYEVKTTFPGTSGERGSGFGLPMSMDIMKAHGGTIRAASRQGEGSTFFVEVPDTKPAVLVADDDEEAVLTLRKYLENMGAGVLTAKTGTEALEIVHEKAPVLVITDLAMPSMDGLALLQNLKTNAKYSHIPVIIITGNRGIGIRQTAFEYKADDFITKPLSEPDFIPRIGRFISG